MENVWKAIKNNIGLLVLHVLSSIDCFQILLQREIFTIYEISVGSKSSNFARIDQLKYPFHIVPAERFEGLGPFYKKTLLLKVPGDIYI